MEKITKSFLALVLMFVGMVSALAQPVAPKAPEAPAAPKATALVTDGSVKQYLYNVGAKGFFIGANDWGTRASFSAEKGYWVQITKNATGDTYTLKNEAKGGNSADCQAVDQIWVDGAGRAGDALWTVTANEDGSFKLGNTNVKGFLSVVPSKNDTKLYMSEAEEAQNVWIVVSEEDYAAYQEAVPAYQAALKEYNDAYAQYQKDYAEWFKANYKAGESLLPLAPANWTGAGGDYGGLANPAKEKYVDGANAPLKAGDVMTQTIEGLKNGKYIVVLEAAGSYTSGRGFECPTGDGLAVAFANDVQENLPIVDRGWVGEGEQNFYTFEVEVADGTLKYGIKNLADAGNWYVARLANIAMIPEKETWFTDNLFCYKDKTINLVDRDTEVNWTADPKDVSNGVIKVVAGIKAGAETQDDHNTQFWIRGAEVVDANDLSKGAFAKGTGFKVTFKVKADGEYEVLPGYYRSKAGSTTAKNDKNAWNHISYFAENLKVTTEWQTVSYVCMSPDDLFTSFGLNLADKTNKTVRTFYFDDVKITGRGGSEWYVNNEFHAKDYQDPSASYSDGQNPHPVARYVADAEGGYVEVISNANAGQTYNSQLWIAIPEKYVGASTKMTMEVQASKAIKCPESFQATATGNGWGCNPGPGSGVEFKVGEWTTVTRILKTKGVKSTGTWKDRQADQYCLDLSEASGDKEAITYKFRNVKFEDAAEPWTETMAYRVKVTPFTQEEDGSWTKGADTNAAPEYNFGTGGEEGGYYQVEAAAKQTNTYETQFFFQIADVAPSKALKVNETVNLKFKVKALATETLPAETALSLGGGYHKSNDGAGWLDGAPAAAIKVGEWTPVELKLEIGKADVTSYSIDLSQDDKGGITYLIDDVEATWAEAPVLDWVELISNGDCEAAPEHTFAAAKEVPVDGSNTNKARVLEGVGKDGSKGIEVVTAAKESQTWDNQFWIYEPYALPAGTNIIVEFDYKADLAGTVDTQSHNAPGGYLHWAAIGNTNFTTEWQHFKYEGKIASECDDNGTARFRSIAFNLSAIADANKFYFDNISFKVPSGTVDGLEPVYIDDYAEKEYIDPTKLDWSDNILKNGDLSGDDMSEFVLKNNDVEDPETLPVEKTAFGDAFEIDVETAARPTNEDGSVGGNDYDAQFFVRLPYVLPKGKKFNLEFDLYAEEINTLAIAAHAEPGQWKANISSVKTDPAVDAVHYQEYLTAPEDMRTIAINLAVATDATYAFSNFSVQVVKDDMAEIEAATTEADAASLWNETLALNEACYAGRTADTEGCSEESVKALTDAVAAGKEVLKKNDATKEEITAATKAIEDALAALRGGEGEYLPKPETDPDYANFVEIPQDQGKDLDTFARTAVEEGADFNTYTASGDLQVAFKMYDIDVAGCDYVTVKFAQPAPKGWNIAFWAQGGTDNVEIPEGATEYKYVFADDAKCAIKDDVLPQICVLTLWPGGYPFDMKVYGIYKHKVATVEDTDLTKEMFFTWDGVGADAEATAQAGCAYDINTSSGMPYGDGTVNEYNYADLSAYDHLAITATEGEPRLLFNRAAQDDHQGPLSVELPRDKGQNKYEAVVENTDGSKTYVINLKEIVAKDGYAHLHAIKGANWANTTVTEMKLFAGSSQYTDVLTNIFEVADDAAVKDGKYFINGQIVIVKDGVKYNAAGLPIE